MNEKYLLDGDLVAIKKILSVALVCVVLATFCSCTAIVMKAVPAKKESTLERYVWAGEAHSSYAYNAIDKRLRPAYDDIVEACLALQDKVNTISLTGEELELIFQAISRDYPIISWLGQQYSYTADFHGGTTLVIEYNMSKEDADIILSKLNGYTTLMLSDISPDMTDYEKAMRVHDKLINEVTYDLEAPNQREVAGALIDKRATCQGYARAYQFLTLKLGLECTVIFGDAGEPHAWNAVRLGDSYYYVDVTFDDRSLTSGSDYLSREFLFQDGETMALTHTPSAEQTIFPLPDCSSRTDNYFTKNNLIIDRADRYEIEIIAKDAAREAIEEGRNTFQLQFTSAALLEEVDTKFMRNGLMDSSISFAVNQYSGVKYEGRVLSDDTFVVTFILKYN